MNFVAIKMLVGDRLKYIALVAGVAFAALLITQQGSIFMGYSLQVGAWIRDTGSVDLWISDPQMEHVEDLKPLTDTSLDRVRSVPGVAWAVPVYKGNLKSQLPDGTLVNARVIGLDDATLIGGPPTITQGSITDLRGGNAVLVNEADLKSQLALKRDGNRALHVGDHIAINDHDARVVGTFRATKEFFWQPVFYTSYSQAMLWAPSERKQLTYVLAKVRPGESVKTVADRINAETGLLARTPAQFDWDTTAWVLKKTGILVNFGITIGLGFVIGLLVAGQTFYTFVLDNLKPFAALKAMGASNWVVLRMLSVQVLVVAAVGYGIGLGSASVAGMMLAKGGLAFQMVWQIPIVGAIAVTICCLSAGCLGMIRVLRVEPGVVFRG